MSWENFQITTADTRNWGTTSAPSTGRSVNPLKKVLGEMNQLDFSAVDTFIRETLNGKGLCGFDPVAEVTLYIIGKNDGNPVPPWVPELGKVTNVQLRTERTMYINQNQDFTAVTVQVSDLRKWNEASQEYSNCTVGYQNREGMRSVLCFEFNVDQGTRTLKIWCEPRNNSLE